MTHCSRAREAGGEFGETRRVEATRDGDTLIDALHETRQDLARADLEAARDDALAMKATTVPATGPSILATSSPRTDLVGVRPAVTLRRREGQRRERDACERLLPRDSGAITRHGKGRPFSGSLSCEARARRTRDFVCAAEDHDLSGVKLRRE